MSNPKYCSVCNAPGPRAGTYCPSCGSPFDDGLTGGVPLLGHHHDSVPIADEPGWWQRSSTLLKVLAFGVAGGVLAVLVVVMSS